jgi:hypothetical protein
VHDHPVRITVDGDLRRSRLTVFFRLLLAIPHFIWIVLWSIAVFFAAIAGWFAALATTRLPEGLHNFLAAYVRYATHLGAYLSIAANPYPGFTGEPGYPVDVAIAAREPLSRWKVALRIFLAIPALILAAVLGSGFGGGGSGQASDSEAEFFASSGVGGVAAVCAILGWFAVMGLGRMPLGIRNLASYGLGYTAQAYSYTLLLTDRYPNADPEALGPTWELPAHPVTLVQDDDGARSRLTVFFRFLFAIPHFVWIVLWTVAAIFASWVNWFVVLGRGRSADPLHRFLTAYIRYTAHVSAFAFLVANPFPGFVGAPGYPVEVAFGEADRQNRWVTFFRFFLSFPAFLLSGALSAVLFVVGFLGWFASLATGRMPSGLRDLGALAIRYAAQTNAYAFLVTDTYPHASPALRPPPAVQPDPAFEPLPEAAV